MTRREDVDALAFDLLLRRAERVVTHAELMEFGLAQSTITYRIRPGGPWQRVLPGVVVAHSGRMTWRERQLGALKYAGPGAMLSGRSGLRAHRVLTGKLRPTEVPHVLIPHGRRRTAHHLATMERCRSLPSPVWRQDMPVAPAAKCLVDASRRDDELDDVRELVAACVQDRHCTVAELVAEVQRATRQRTALTRAALAELDAGIRSVAEAKVREVVLASPLSVPLFNPTLRTIEGEFIACPDGYFSYCAAGYEIDSFAYHLRRRSYLNTQRRLRRTARHGVLLLGVSPVDAYEDPAGFVDDLRAFVEIAEQRRAPQIVVEAARSAA